jgi:protein-S-isoprenylcysteine O-methyltransferase Ste14
MRDLARVALALWLNIVAFLAVGTAAFADHLSGIGGGSYAQPWVIIVITFLFAGVGGLGLLWAFRPVTQRVSRTRGRPLRSRTRRR